MKRFLANSFSTLSESVNDEEVEETNAEEGAPSPVKVERGERKRKKSWIERYLARGFADLEKSFDKKKRPSRKDQRKKHEFSRRLEDESDSVAEISAVEMTESFSRPSKEFDLSPSFEDDMEAIESPTAAKPAHRWLTERGALALDIFAYIFVCTFVIAMVSTTSRKEIAVHMESIDFLTVDTLMQMDLDCAYYAYFLTLSAAWVALMTLRWNCHSKKIRRFHIAISITLSGISFFVLYNVDRGFLEQKSSAVNMTRPLVPDMGLCYYSNEAVDGAQVCSFGKAAVTIDFFNYTYGIDQRTVLDLISNIVSAMNMLSDLINVHGFEEDNMKGTFDKARCAVQLEDAFCRAFITRKCTNACEPEPLCDPFEFCETIQHACPGIFEAASGMSEETKFIMKSFITGLPESLLDDMFGLFVTRCGNIEKYFEPEHPFCKGRNIRGQCNVRLYEEYLKDAEAFNEYTARSKLGNLQGWKEKRNFYRGLLVGCATLASIGAFLGSLAAGSRAASRRRLPLTSLFVKKTNAGISGIFGIYFLVVLFSLLVIIGFSFVARARGERIETLVVFLAAEIALVLFLRYSVRWSVFRASSGNKDATDISSSPRKRAMKRAASSMTAYVESRFGMGGKYFFPFHMFSELGEVATQTLALNSYARSQDVGVITSFLAIISLNIILGPIGLASGDPTLVIAIDGSIDCCFGFLTAYVQLFLYEDKLSRIELFTLIFPFVLMMYLCRQLIEYNNLKQRRQKTVATLARKKIKRKMAFVGLVSCPTGVALFAYFCSKMLKTSIGCREMHSSCFWKGSVPKVYFENGLFSSNMTCGEHRVHTINAAGCGLPAVTTLDMFTNLRVANFRDNTLAQFPPELAELNSLQSVFLRGNPILDVPVEYVKVRGRLRDHDFDVSLAHVQQLDWSLPSSSNHGKHTLYSWPIAELEVFTNLKSLSLNGHSLKKIDTRISDLFPLLETLHVAHNSLVSSGLPPASILLHPMPKLSVFSIAYNNLTTVPQDYARWAAEVSTRILEFEGNHRIRNLTWTDIELSALPDTIGSLGKSLRHFTASFTQITSLPPSFANLTHLESIDLVRTPNLDLLAVIRNLPSSVSTMKLGGWDVREFTAHPLVSADDFFQELNRFRSLQYISAWGLNLDGEIGSFSLLTNLVHVDLRYNRLNGTIPKGLLSAKSLKQLHLSSTHLVGTIASEFGNLKSLKHLSLGGWDGGSSLIDANAFKYARYSMKEQPLLGGYLPKQFAKLSNLQSLFLQHIDTQVFFPGTPLCELNLHTFVYFGGKRNCKYGASPLFDKSIVNLSVPEDLWHSIYFGSGCLLPNTLRVLEHRHVPLEGHLPDLPPESNLISLRLADTFLRGTIPPSFGRIPYQLWLDHNELVGTIPRELGSVESLMLHYNNLTGTLPPEMERIREYNVMYNNLTGNVSSFTQGFDHLAAQRISFQKVYDPP